MHIIHLELDDLLHVLDPGLTVWVQPITHTSYTHGLPDKAETMIYLGCQQKGMLHVGRILVESYHLLMADRDLETLYTAVAGRLEQAYSLVVAQLERGGLHILPGLLLTPSLREDLKVYRMAQNLWTWDNPKDPLARRLVPLVDTLNAA